MTTESELKRRAPASPTHRARSPAREPLIESEVPVVQGSTYISNVLARSFEIDRAEHRRSLLFEAVLE